MARFKIYTSCSHINFLRSQQCLSSKVAGQLLVEDAARTLEEALNLNITLYGDAELHRQALNLAKSLRLPASYDAHYLAPAQRLEVEFWTGDRGLVNSVQAVLPWANLVG